MDRAMYVEKIGLLQAGPGGGNAPKKEPPLAPPPASIMHGWIHPVHDGRHHHGPGHEAMRHDASMMPFLRDRHSMHHGWQKASP